MNFLEKDLEDIIFNNIDRCHARGLSIINSHRFEMHRQFRLDPFGVADIVIFEYDPCINTIVVNIIECKKNKIDLEAYHQVKRYAYATRQAFMRDNRFRNSDLHIYCYLIGQQIELNGDFVYVFSSDDQVNAYKYTYDFDGIYFEPVSKRWTKGDKQCTLSKEVTESFLDLCSELSNEYQKELKEEIEGSETQEENAAA